MRRDLAGVLLILVSAVSFGGVGPLARLAYDEGAAPQVVLATRFTTAAVATFAFVLLTARVRHLPRGRDLAAAFALGLLGYWATAGLFFEAMRTIPVGLASVLLFTNPIPVALLSWIILRERATLRFVGSLLLALPGVALLTVIGVGDLDPRGVTFALASALTYAVTIVAARRFMGAHTRDPTAFTSVVLAGAATGFLVSALAIEGTLALPTTRAWGYAILMGFVSTGVSIVTFFEGVARVTAPKAAALSTAEPAATVALGAAFLGEVLTAGQILGGVLVAAAVIILASGRAAERYLEPGPREAAAPEDRAAR